MTSITLSFVLSHFYDLLVSPSLYLLPFSHPNRFTALSIFLRRYRNSVNGNGPPEERGRKRGTLFIPKSIHLGYTDISPRGRLRKDNNYRPGYAYLESRERRRSNESAERASRRREDGDEKGAPGAWREKPGSRRQHLPVRGPHKPTRSRHADRSK